MKKLHIILLGIISVSLFLISFSLLEISDNADVVKFQTRAQDLPEGFNELFAGSGECVLCHDNTASTMIDDLGNSVSVTDDWRSSMKANAAKDPFWRAKVSHEGIVNPNHKEALESVCTRCHAPQGRFEAYYQGATSYGVADIHGDALANDGVSCTVCHQIRPDSLMYNSGNLLINDNHDIYGQYIDPFVNPMINNIDYEPVYSEHIRTARLCGTCHTLLTNSVDMQGNFTGTQFVEQAVYHEWENSQYPTNGVTCQKCHMPEINDLVTLSPMPPWLDGRTPFSKHFFTGANVQMLRILKDNIDSLGVTAEIENLDNTIERTLNLLQNNTVNLTLSEEDRNNDFAYYKVEIENFAGHKFPSGYPSRRAYVEFIVVKDSGDTIFHSGEINQDFYLPDEDSDFEPHYDLIDSDDKVQIYEMVMGDVNNDLTTVLERAVSQLKDNRIPPIGFSSGYYNYDTVKVVGEALIDDNFNTENSIEGSGKDIITYKIPMNSYTGELYIIAKIHYQTVNPKWLEEMFQHSSYPIDKFKSMYDNSDKTPVLLVAKMLHSNELGFEDIQNGGLEIYPNPSLGDINLRYTGEGFIEGYKLLNSAGKSVKQEKELCVNEFVISTSDLSGVFVAEVFLSNNRKLERRVVIN